MSESHPFDFTPVPLRPRRDGWTPERQRRFVALLAEGAGPSEAAEAVGKSKQTAFTLRRRPGAESFAAAWDAAVRYAAERRRREHEPSRLQQSLDGVLIPRFYRGRLVSVERRYPSGGLMRALAQLNRWRTCKRAGAENIAFEELLDLIAPRQRQRKLTRLR
jgi:hypothetical protein